MSILQKIISEHFHKLNNSDIKIRDTVIENVDKVIHCGDFKRGYALYGCNHCGHLMVTPFFIKILSKFFKKNVDISFFLRYNINVANLI